MTADTEDLAGRIRHWLERQGYPLEMRVAQAFQRGYANVIQSEYYRDPISKQSREIDLVVSWQDDIDEVLFRVSMAIECKSSRDKPWILFASNRARLAPPARVAQRAASNLGHIFLWRVAEEQEVQDLSLFSLPENPGYSLTQAFTSGQDVCYSAASGAASAAAGLASEANEYSKATSDEIVEIVFPVVVTDARLFTATLNENDQLELKEQSTGTLLWRNPIFDVAHTIIHVLTIEAVARFAEHAEATARRLIECAKNSQSQHLNDARRILKSNDERSQK